MRAFAPPPVPKQMAVPQDSENDVLDASNAPSPGNASGITFGCTSSHVIPASRVLKRKKCPLTGSPSPIPLRGRSESHQGRRRGGPWTKRSAMSCLYRCCETCLRLLAPPDRRTSRRDNRLHKTECLADRAFPPRGMRMGVQLLPRSLVARIVPCVPLT
jgi:hypothetical protein